MDMSLEVVTRDFDRWVAGYVREYPGEQSKALRNVMLNLIERVTKRTPVDLGRLHAAWLPYARHAGVPMPTTGKSPEAQARGLSEGSFREDLQGANQFIEITNGVPYVVRIEFGHSSVQAPAGMVRVSLREMMVGEIDEEFEAALVRTNRKAERG
jgi:hypothetical protein